MPKQYFDQTKKYFDLNQKYFVDNLDQEVPPKKEEALSSVISRDFTRRRDLKPFTKPKSAFHTHITVDDAGDTIRGGVSTQAIADFKDWADTRKKQTSFQGERVPPGSIKTRAEQVFKDVNVAFKDVDLAFNNTLKRSSKQDFKEDIKLVTEKLTSMGRKCTTKERVKKELTQEQLSRELKEACDYFHAELIKR